MGGLHPLDYLPAFAFLVLIFSLGELFVVQIRSRNILLAAVFLGFAMVLIRAWLLLTMRMHLVAPFFEITMPVLMFIGPMIRAFLEERVAQRPISWSVLLLHFIPGILVSLILIPNLLESTPEKLARIEAIYRGQPSGPGVWIFPLGLVHNIFYMAWAVRDLSSDISLDSLKKEGVIRASLVFPGLTILGSSVALVALLSGHLGYLGLSISIIALNGPMVYFVQRRYPQFFHDLEVVYQREKEKNRYQKTRLGGIDVKDLESRLGKIMEMEQAFKEEDLSLPELASRLDITVHQLSEYINHHLNQNFSGFVNQYRVRAACKMLLEEKERTVLSIAYDVGFNSKSTFNDAFQRHTGISPGQYRKKPPSL